MECLLGRLGIEEEQALTPTAKEKKKEKVNLSSSFLSWYSHLFLLDTRFKSHVYSKSPLGLRIADYRASHVSG